MQPSGRQSRTTGQDQGLVVQRPSEVELNHAGAGKGVNGKPDVLFQPERLKTGPDTEASFSCSQCRRQAIRQIAGVRDLAISQEQLGISKLWLPVHSDNQDEWARQSG